MRIVFAFGPRKGEIHDVSVPIARAMIADGRATPVPLDGAAPAPGAVATTATTPQTRDPVIPTSRRGRRR
jgi:hypothetical protein